MDLEHRISTPPSESLSEPLSKSLSESPPDNRRRIAHRIAVAQINPTVGDLIGNAEKIIESVEKAKALGADIVIFPEQVVTGYPAQDLLLHEDFINDVSYINEQIAANVHGITAILGSVERIPMGPNGKSLHNVAYVMEDGKIMGKQAKTLLPTYDVFDEKRYFEPADSLEPILIKGVKYGIHICEDMWSRDYAINIPNELAAKGAEVLINLSASPFYSQKIKLRSEIIKGHAVENKVPFILVNMVGAQDELIFDGGSMVLRPDGTISDQYPQFEEGVYLIDPASKRTSLETIPKDEEIIKALTCGVRDFFQKNNLKKAILGLSGGIDSAVTAALAVEALGPESVKGLALPSGFSSNHSIEDARLLAKNLGIDFDIIPIKGMYDAAVRELERTFEGKPFDVTEENIQARLRMMTLMAYANKHGYTLLATGDKSEIALGYCTLYGDTSGAIAVISDLTKPEVYAVARAFNAMKGSDIIPKHTLEKPPSPELKPGQVAPFDYDRLSPVLEELTNRKPVRSLIEKGFSRDEILTLYRRWKGNEFKRWQSPIALKCKKTSFGMGRVYPITNRYVPSELCL